MIIGTVVENLPMLILAVIIRSHSDSATASTGHFEDGMVIASRSLVLRAEAMAREWDFE
jgi:hypothetical protein